MDIFLMLSPGQPDVLLSKLDGKGGGINQPLRSLHCDHIVCSGEEVVVCGDGLADGSRQEKDQTGSEHHGSSHPTAAKGLL